MTCNACRHCGPIAEIHKVSGAPLIRCQHPSFDDEDDEMSHIDTTFAEICADYEASTTTNP